MAALSRSAGSPRRVRFRHAAPITDGTTTTTGWVVVPSDDSTALSLIWPTEAEGEPRPDEQLIVFAVPHPGQSTTGGRALPAYDVVRAGGAFVKEGDEVRRLCREARSEQAPEAELGL